MRAFCPRSLRRCNSADQRMLSKCLTLIHTSSDSKVQAGHPCQMQTRVTLMREYEWVVRRHA